MRDNVSAFIFLLVSMMKCVGQIMFYATVSYAQPICTIDPVALPDTKKILLHFMLHIFGQALLSTVLRKVSKTI